MRAEQRQVRKKGRAGSHASVTATVVVVLQNEKLEAEKAALEKRVEEAEAQAENYKLAFEVAHFHSLAHPTHPHTGLPSHRAALATVIPTQRLLSTVVRVAAATVDVAPHYTAFRRSTPLPPVRARTEWHCTYSTELHGCIESPVGIHQHSSDGKVRGGPLVVAS